MKRLFFVLASTLVLCSLWLMPACGTFGVVIGSGDLETQDFNLADFSRVQVENTFNVEIRQAAAYSVKVTVDDNLMDYVRVTRNGDTLVLSARSGYSYPNSTFRAQVTMPNLRELRLSGASKADVAGFTARENLRVTASGASSAYFLNTHAGTLDVEISGASAVKGALDADGNAVMNLSGASTVELTGSAQDLNVEASGASQVRLSGFTVRNAGVNLSGASQGTVNAGGTLSGTLSGASHLGYRGNPTLGDINTSGGSSVGRE